MNKINITIPDNLDAQGELLEIAKHLGKKLLPTKQKALGNGYRIKHSETQITIKRKPVEKAIVTRECPVCNTLFADKAGKTLWVNYGGNPRKVHHCSEGCREVLIQICGSRRTAIKRKDLQPVRTW